MTKPRACRGLRETDDDRVHGATLFIDTDQALAQGGDLQGRTVFKSVGTALDDLAAARRVFNEVTASQDRRRAD
jgi:ornithine cyclodeaminase/alanine dehydrogenase-like protein (mu-crystallin family)